MPKVEVYRDEWWPVYTLREDISHARPEDIIEVTPEFLERWKKWHEQAKEFHQELGKKLRDF
jgi:hypothetical protein